MLTPKKFVRAEAADRFTELRDETVAAASTAAQDAVDAVAAALASDVAQSNANKNAAAGSATSAATSAANAANSAAQAQFSGYVGQHATKSAFNGASGKATGYHIVLSDESKTPTAPGVYPPWAYYVTGGAASGPGFGVLLPNADRGLSLPAALRFTGSVAVGDTTTLRPFYTADTDAPAAFASGMSRLANPGLSRDHWVYWAGFNYGPGAARIDSSRHAAGSFIEDYFGNAGEPLTEAYHQIAFQNGEGIRPWAVYANVDRTHATRTGVGGTKKVAVIFDGDAYTFQRPAGGGQPALNMFTVEEVFTDGVTRVEGGIAGDWQVAGRFRPLGREYMEALGEMRFEAPAGADAFVPLIHLKQGGNGFPAGVGFVAETGFGEVVRQWMGADPWQGDKKGMTAWAANNPSASSPAWDYAMVLRGTGDLEMLNPGAGVIKRAPNGSRYRYTIDNSGNEVKTLLNDGGDTTIGGVSVPLGKVDTYLL